MDAGPRGGGGGGSGYGGGGGWGSGYSDGDDEESVRGVDQAEERREALEIFMAVTQVTSSATATQFLDATSWSPDAAIKLFLASGEDAETATATARGSGYDDDDEGGGGVSPSLKVALIGAEGAGKTTLARGLGGQELPGVNAHIQQWVPDIGLPHKMLIWDFAGADEYYSPHQLFLTEGALNVLVVDLYKFYHDSLSRGDAVYLWLDSLLLRVPGSAVLVVATHADAFGDDNLQRSEAARDLLSAIEDHLNTRGQEWLAAQQQDQRERSARARRAVLPHDSLETSSRIGNPPGLQLCADVEISGHVVDDVTRLRNRILEVANDCTIFPDLGLTLPKKMERMWAVMDAIRMGTDPRVAVRLEDVVATGGCQGCEFISHTRAFELWRNAENELPGGNMDSEDIEEQFKAAVNHRQRGGFVLAAHGLVHLNPFWINDLLQPLLDDDHVVGQEGEMEKYGKERGYRFNRLENSQRRFVRTGLLGEDYLRFLWRKVVRSGDVFHSLVETMMTHAAMIPCDGDGAVTAVGDRLFMVPARLPRSISTASLSRLEQTLSRGTRLQYVFEVRSKHIPPEIIAQFLGGLGRGQGRRFNQVVFNTCWSRGASFEVDGRGCLIRLGGAITETWRMIELNIAGTDREAVSDLGSQMRNQMIHLLETRYQALPFVEREPSYMDGNEAWLDSLNALGNDLKENLGQHLDRVLEQILGSLEARSLSHEQAQGELNRLRADMKHDISVQLTSNQQETVRRLEDSVRRSLSGISTGQNGFSETDRRILISLARNVASVRWPIPYLVCVLPAPKNEPLSERDRSYEVWSADLVNWCEGNRRSGRGIATRELRVFFLCAHDESLAECGLNGQGYKIKTLLEWARAAAPLVNVGLILASIALRVCTGLSIPTDQIEAVLGDPADGRLSDYLNEVVEEGARSGIEELRSRVEEKSDGDANRMQRRLKQVRPVPVQGFTYDRLTEVVRKFEDGAKKHKQSQFPGFDAAMRLVDRGGRGEEWAWVRTCNIGQFVSSLPSSPPEKFRRPEHPSPDNHRHASERTGGGREESKSTSFCSEVSSFCQRLRRLP